jgi:hypothetical protein
VDEAAEPVVIGAHGWPPQNVLGLLLRAGADQVIGEGVIKCADRRTDEVGVVSKSESPALLSVRN